MPAVMKGINAISRCQALFRADHAPCENIAASHWAFVFTICRSPGMTQEEIAGDLCINKSTVTRTLSYLEEHGFVNRVSDKNDRRALRVYPTDKMLEIFPKLRASAREWNALIAEDVSEEEIEFFMTVLDKMQSRARKIVGMCVED